MKKHKYFTAFTPLFGWAAPSHTGDHPVADQRPRREADVTNELPIIKRSVAWRFPCRRERRIRIGNPSLLVSEAVLIADVFLSVLALFVKAEPILGMSPFTLIVVLLTLTNTVRVLATECF